MVKGIVAMICDDCDWRLTRDDVEGRLSSTEMKPKPERVKDKFHLLRKAHIFYHPDCEPRYQRGQIDDDD